MMSLKNFLNSLLLILLMGCSIAEKNSAISFKYSKDKYTFEDKSGRFWFNRESGFKGESKDFVVKREIFVEGMANGPPLEQSISISKLAKFNEKMQVLVPHVSQFVVWFDQKKYFNHLKFASDGKSLNLKLISPEHKWSKIEKIEVPKDAKLLCFYSQVMECASVTGFIKKAHKLKRGVMSFYLIWDGYPYVQEQYPGVTQSLFAKAKLKYDGVLKRGENRFSLEVSGQAIFFIIDDNGKMIKKFWVAQGLSMVKR